jgi:hypothetical protein
VRLSQCWDQVCGPSMLAFLGGSASKHLLARQVLSPAKRLSPKSDNFLPQKKRAIGQNKAAIGFARVCDFSRCGAARKQKWVHTSFVMKTRFWFPVQGETVEGAPSRGFMPAQSGFVNLRDSEKLLRGTAARHAGLELSRPAPRLDRWSRAAQMGALRYV